MGTSCNDVCVSWTACAAFFHRRFSRDDGVLCVLLRCDGVFVFGYGTFAKDAFEKLYGPLAKTQAEGMEPIVTAFLEGTL